MRINKASDAMCCNCWHDRNNSLEMFDVCIGDEVLTICDECNEQLFNKTLRATVGVQGKLKSQHDLKIIQSRHKRY